MKKLFTLITLLTAGLIGTYAQGTDKSYQFVDEKGNVIEDGTTVVRNEPEIDPFGEVALHSGLYVKNVSAPSNYSVRIESTISRIDNGNVQVCFPTLCHNYDWLGTYKSEEGKMAVGEAKSIQAEWLPNSATSYGECIVVHQAIALEPFGKTWLDYPGPTVTVHYIFADPAGISTIEADQKATWHDAEGRQLDTPRRGLNIVRLGDGSVKKFYRR